MNSYSILSHTDGQNSCDPAQHEGSLTHSCGIELQSSSTYCDICGTTHVWGGRSQHSEQEGTSGPEEKGQLLVSAPQQNSAGHSELQKESYTSTQTSYATMEVAPLPTNIEVGSQDTAKPPAIGEYSKSEDHTGSCDCALVTCA